ncbi:ras-related protein RABB1b [Histomonas meleagridis]|uniref:ras-related protein RABB1b n=1 Tax=Histomonas meleagridis TaxID=135588 RepID=UPI003559CF5C|nr:ras-related protein RABB1b [Histomonas meleagridis]KAH0797664.1 ras-related protein RABB1b [Histomonas meleagridis]
MSSKTPQDQICFKFIIVGNSAVGKSCLLLRFDEGRFQPIHDVTVGVTFSIKILQINGREVKVQIWDTAGQEVFRSITRSYYRDSACAIIVYDITDSTTFDKVDSWIEDVRNLSPANCHIVLVGNKSDLNDKRAVQKDKAQEYANSKGINYYETSALTGEGVEELFNECVQDVFNNSLGIHTLDQSVDVAKNKEGKKECCK